MKTTMTPTSSPAWSLIEILQLMKTKLTILKYLIILCCAFATTAVFGQTIQTWDGGDGTGTAIGAATNWSGDTSPNSAAGDICQWDGTVAGNLFLTADTANGLFNNGTPGVNFYVAASHTGSLNISSRVAASGNIALNGVSIDSGAGAFSLGNGSANVLNIIMRPSSSSSPGPVHDWTNNSASAVIIYPNVRWQSGGGNPHQLLFDGTGDWIVTNNLTFANGTAIFIEKAGSGTLFWSGPSIAGALGNTPIASPLDFEGGRAVLLASGLLGTQRITNNATLEYAANAPQTLSGPIDGNGLLIVSAGTLTLSSTLSDFSGNIVLTNGGVLVAGGNQNIGGTGPLGVGGTISFGGGTLQFSVANTFDYSPRFSTAASQAYKFDTGGQSVTLTNALISSGGTLTKLGSGTLTLTGANTYDGATTVSAGKLIIQGSQGNGAITVANSAALGANQGGAQITPASLTVGTSSSATLEFNNVSSAGTAAIAVSGAVSAGGAITVNVNSGSFIIGQSYPLFSWGSGSAPAVTLGTLVGAVGNLTTNGSTIKLNITGLAYVWTGLTDGNWDIATVNNWTVNGGSQIWANNSAALFDDTVTGQTNVTLNAPISAASVTVNNSTKPYSITSSGANLIGGAGGLTKNGNSILTLSGGVNTYSGATTISGGTLSVSALDNGSSASDIGAAGNGAANLVLNGGTLQYTGGAQSSDHLFTLGTANGAIDASGSDALNLSNAGSVALSGSGARTLTLKGTSTADNTLSAKLADNGGATALTKSGAGKWIVDGNNTNSGTVTVAAGTLQVGAGGASGTLGSGNIVDNGTLIFNTSGTVTNGTVTGTGSLTVDGGGTVVLPGDNGYTGGTTVNNGTLQVGIGGATGKLASTGPIVDNGTVIFDSTASFNISGFGADITGSGNLIKHGASLLKIFGNNSYSGWTEIGPGASLQVSEGAQGQFASSVVTNYGTLIMGRQDTGVFSYNGSIVGPGSLMKILNNGNAGDVTLTGASTYTGGTYILGGAIILADGGTIVGDVFMTNDYAHNQFGTAPNDFVPATLTFSHSDDIVFPGNIVGPGFVTFNGSGTVTLTGNNAWTGGGTQTATTINAGTVQVGNGSTSGSLSATNLANNGVLVFNRSDSVTFAGVISGGGSLVQSGSGTLTLTANNTYSGTTTVSNGTLVINGNNSAASTYVAAGTLGGNGTLNGPVTLDAGTTLATGASVGTLTINSDLSFGGNLAIEVNKSLSPSNDLVVVSGVLTNTGTGTLTVSNLGPALAVGDTFTLFSQAVSNGAAMTVTGAGATWQNNLAVDGSITALTVPATVNTNAPVMHVSVSGNTLSLAWPTNLGWTLQTNSVGLSAANQWFPYAGSSTITNVSITINPAKANVFFRMVYTNTP
jgi:fibronectin-binding autotransporter adhesin